MEVNIIFPETARVSPPYKIQGPMNEARQSFYELAKSKIRYLTSDETVEWNRTVRGMQNVETSASFVGNHPVQLVEHYKVAETPEELTESKHNNGGIPGHVYSISFERWVRQLEIILNKDAFHIDGEDFTDCIPFCVEHEIFETWLTMKPGAASSIEQKKRHLLARRREFLMAEQQGLGGKYFRLHMLWNHSHENEYRDALAYARKKNSNELRRTSEKPAV